ncbi:efflux RND transporter permease subunit [Legionella worsleiensis]|uniref:Efflux pump membrane transporter n=1 Tax=Legionella worsleiensis TaxID=45076 RepID=A0A0W1A5U2_9GAMM|nr:multidrug efflux RND transporter permease subunit [Legionella worsleiensis]KTD76727.1 putative multidrug-efflux system transmembrane protein [Legionella worsleiensis]STY30513.1 multidrug-efflux system transmembrane protein [Legionella worsleiensis]
MKMPHFFIERPIFAAVLSIIILIVGSLAYFNLPVEQYPQVVPPTIQVTASYPGANAKTVADTVATPIEQEINGVENMLYMDSQSSNDGQMRLTVTFKMGTDLDMAQVLVQNRIAIAEPKLPEAVRRIGVKTIKNSPDLLLVINMYSLNKKYDQTYLGNYAILQIRDKIKRINGVSDFRLSGASEYAMRIWLNPDLMNSYDITANEVNQALTAQNVQIASGVLNKPPQKSQLGIEYIIETQGRLVSPEEFGQIIIKSGTNGQLVRLKDIARVEIGTQEYSTKGYLGKNPAIAIPIFQRPGTNAIEAADQIKATMQELAKSFPKGIVYDIVYNPTDYVAESILAVEYTIYEAIVFVVLVILLFLQSWRAALIPIIAIPISLIGTFAVMDAIGFSLNYLTLFGLVLAIGIVVDDAIVVIENMERNIRSGMSPKEAAHKTMSEVGSALVAIGLVLVFVFLPTLFLQGLSGRFYQQFGATIAIATIISVFVSLTLSPALAALMLKPHQDTKVPLKSALWNHPVRLCLHGFNRFIDSASRVYGRIIARLIHHTSRMLILYAVLISATLLLFGSVPRGFIPSQDQGYFIVSIQLPPGASLSRTDTVVNDAINKILATPGVKNAVAFTGFSGATFVNQSNSAAIFCILKPFDERRTLGLNATQILTQLRTELGSIKDAFIVVIPPPPVRGVGNAGGFKMMVQDRGGRGTDALFAAVNTLAEKANQAKTTTSVFTLFENSTPSVYLDFDKEKAEQLGVPIARVVEALEMYLGSVFVNEFNYLGRTYRVIIQAEDEYRKRIEDIYQIKVRNNKNDMVPIGSLALIKNKTNAARIPRYNLYPAIDLLGDVAPGYSTGEALATMEQLADEYLPEGISYEWTDIAYQQKSAGNTAFMAFLLGVVFVYLVLAAQYESLTMPLAVILIVPMCLFSAMLGIKIWGMDNNIMTQMGFIILIGLASKNAILIVEFARTLERNGANRWKAAIQAAKLRLRPILMTSLAFILGVFPLVIAQGAGAEMRQALGVAVFSGMIGVTFFGLIFTPIFYVLTSQLASLFTKK